MAQFKVGDKVRIKGQLAEIMEIDENRPHQIRAHLFPKTDSKYYFEIFCKLESIDKTADEMLAELGYSYQYEFGGFGYVGHQYKWKQPCNGAEKILLFNDIDKELQVHNETDYHLSPNEIKAIHKKLEELGWL